MIKDLNSATARYLIPWHLDDDDVDLAAAVTVIMIPWQLAVVLEAQVACYSVVNMTYLSPFWGQWAIYIMVHTISISISASLPPPPPTTTTTTIIVKDSD